MLIFQLVKIVQSDFNVQRTITLSGCRHFEATYSRAVQEYKFRLGQSDRKMATPDDRNILNSILNPLLPLGEGISNGEDELGEDIEEDTTEVREAKELEKEGVKAAENGDVEKSIDIFGKCIAIAPRRASGYNNRAQALRLKGNVSGAMEDLNKAITLSEGKGKVASYSFCQRALIHQLESRKDEAKRDYESAARLGSEFAKTMLVNMNPYAALCNQMLAEVMQKLQQGIVSE